jgi:hypothetical protein
MYQCETDEHENADAVVPALQAFMQRPIGRRVKSEPPRTVDALKPYVHSRVLKQLGLGHHSQLAGGTEGVGRAGRQQPLAGVRWTGGRKKQPADNVDSLLVRELREEEPGWVDYSTEELMVKLQLADALYELLLNDTAQTLRQVTQRRHRVADMHGTD